jgi:hypothetical protein
MPSVAWPIARRAARMLEAEPLRAPPGYYDQAHLIGDFRDLVGITPAAFVKS